MILCLNSSKIHKCLGISDHSTPHDCNVRVNLRRNELKIRYSYMFLFCIYIHISIFIFQIVILINHTSQIFSKLFGIIKVEVNLLSTANTTPSRTQIPRAENPFYFTIETRKKKLLFCFFFYCCCLVFFSKTRTFPYFHCLNGIFNLVNSSLRRISVSPFIVSGS